MGLFGHWSKKRDREDEERLKDFGAILDRIEERLKEEKAETETGQQAEQPETPQE